ncbi:DNA polymerase IV 1 [Alicyclobacillus hesperidum]|uniref:DNA polymerase IV n=1 Tax=Alicyclobacillus hesperidum TaxID=89784 RepID=A0A1H2QUY1_9BACL|nr:DNA polymerase IV [Alicyclobacillus hesperidum]GLV13287.1 DNA polymerase IV 1 [Alicyclobacillus hesperidum]SDW10997.1 DNA polymerase-4 [Alicyclobacillus hesperidum]
MDRERQILHIDMNAFYASCHVAQSPDRYRGKPIAVAGNPETRHGIVVTASYEARARGVRTTMTVAEAMRACPELLVIRPDFPLYRTFARQVFDIVRRFTPAVEIVSIDECYADVTGSGQFGDAMEIARRIQSILRAELQLPCSIGVATNKFFAKMGSDLRKPMAITRIDDANYQSLLWPLPVSAMYGVGRRTALALYKAGIRTIGDLAVAPLEVLERTCGSRGAVLQQHANGLDERPVVSERPSPKSVGHSVTLPVDATDQEIIRRTLLQLADQVGRRLRKHGKAGRVVTLTIRDKFMHTISRQSKRAMASNLTEDIYGDALALLNANWPEQKPIRLLGISVSELVDVNEVDISWQLGLFDSPRDRAAFDKRLRLQKLTEVTDSLRNRFGEHVVVRGRMLDHDGRAAEDQHARGTSLQTDNLHEEESNRWKS